MKFSVFKKDDKTHGSTDGTTSVCGTQNASERSKPFFWPSQVSCKPCREGMLTILEKEKQNE